jgi:DNA-binding CsgD family transcriptional regulator
MWGGGLAIPSAIREAAEAARAAPPGHDPPRPEDLLLDAFAVRLTDGYVAAAPALTEALALFLALDVGSDEVGGWLWRAGSRASGIIALELWDYEAWHALAVGQVRFARETGALVHLQSALNFLAWTHLSAGELIQAGQIADESSVIAEATEYSPIPYTPMFLAALRGQEAPASALIESVSKVMTASGVDVTPAAYASSVLYNGLGHHDTARDAASRAFDRDPVGYGPLVVSELGEAASRTGDMALLASAIEWMMERTRVSRTDWSLGIEARLRALHSDGPTADNFYLASIEHLGRTRISAELARSHLLYGEWLRREARRVDARGHLRTAYDMLTTMGLQAFAERAGRVLLATGETVRKRTVETRDELTAQEAQIARLARDGLSNPEISVRLFISPRTVKYHLQKVFTKLDISFRGQLGRVLPAEPAGAPSL